MKRAIIVILALSVGAIAFLFWLIYVNQPGDHAVQWSFLPDTNAAFNAISACAVLIGLYQIRRGRRRAHGICMGIAFAASALFLVGYIAHHALHGDSRYLGTGWLRPTYFFVLASHILLSMAVLPMVLTTLLFAAMRRWSAHRSLARWTWPAWLYVSVTGVLVFVFLRFLNIP